MAVEATIDTPTDDADRVLVDVADGVGRITFNNPARHNAMSREMWLTATEALAAFGRDDAVRAVLLTGAGNRAFVAGADISKFESERASVEQVEAYDRSTATFHQVLSGLEKPTIARIDGYCIGGGLAIAVGCDIRIASAKSTFAIPAAKLGIGYKFGGIRELTQLIGPSFAAEIFYTGRQFDAEEARIMGLVNRVLPDDGLDAHVEELLARIARNAPLAIQTVKRSLIEIAKPDAEQDVAACDALVRKCFMSKDYVEGRTAFMQKRPPKFAGE